MLRLLWGLLCGAVAVLLGLNVAAGSNLVCAAAACLLLPLHLHSLSLPPMPPLLLTV
jgi:hypothetical protein